MSVVFILDRFVKLLIAVNLDYGEIVPVMSFLNITYINNTGIAFSMLSGNNRILIWINFIIIIIFIFMLILSKLKKGPVYIAYGLILGGALSNLWDRYFYNGVIDYIDFKIWPVFNFADTGITIGALLILFSMVSDVIISIKKKEKLP